MAVWLKEDQFEEICRTSFDFLVTMHGFVASPIEKIANGFLLIKSYAKHTKRIEVSLEGRENEIDVYLYEHPEEPLCRITIIEYVRNKGVNPTPLLKGHREYGDRLQRLAQLVKDHCPELLA